MLNAVGVGVCHGLGLLRRHLEGEASWEHPKCSGHLRVVLLLEKQLLELLLLRVEVLDQIKVVEGLEGAWLLLMKWVLPHVMLFNPCLLLLLRRLP